MRRNTAGTGRGDDEADTGSTWRARHSCETIPDHQRPTIKKMSLEDSKASFASISPAHYRYSKSRRDPAQRRPDHQHVIRQRSNGPVRTSELFLEQGGHHCGDQSLRPRVCAPEHHSERDRSGFHRRRMSKACLRSNAKLHQANSARTAW